jgi:hypothetical protein
MAQASSNERWESGSECNRHEVSLRHVLCIVIVCAKVYEIRSMVIALNLILARSASCSDGLGSLQPRDNGYMNAREYGNEP